MKRIGRGELIERAEWERRRVHRSQKEDMKTGELIEKERKSSLYIRELVEEE